MRGSNSLQVKPYREDGRLLIEAVSAPSSDSCLKVERSNGRVRMSLVKEEEEDVDDHNEEEKEAETETEVSMEGKFGIDIDEEEGGKDGEVEKEKEEEEVEVVEGKELGLVKLGEDLDGIRIMFRGKMGKGDEFRRRNTPCRCKEGGRGNTTRLINWEPFWVTT